MGYIRSKWANYRPLRKKIRRLSLLVGIFSCLFSIVLVICLKWFPVLITPLMVIRSAEYAIEGKTIPLRKAWVSLNEISPHLQRAVIASEDPKFLDHSGFDFEAIGRAIDKNKRSKRKVGASTISQQTAKNVFLYPSRTYLRKFLEAYFTVLIETFWGKKRILEVYLNVIELGPGIYGAEAASKFFYKKPAVKLYPGEAHLFAAILPNPRLWDPRRPTNFVLRRRNFILRNLNILGTSYFKPLLTAQN